MSLYRGEHDRSASWWNELLDVDSLPAAYRVDAHASLALLAGYQGDLRTARDHAERARVTAEVAGADSARAFAGYATGETVLLADPPAAVSILRAAAADGQRARATHVTAVARIALLSALTRLGRHAEALDLTATALRDELRTGTWTQVWTTLRILAELLAALDRTETAALLLAAGRAAPSAPTLKGGDVERYQALEERIGARLGSGTVERIGVLARALPRTQTVDRALDAVNELAVATAGT